MRLSSAATTRSYPRVASSSATARPIPVDAPVTTARGVASLLPLVMSGLLLGSEGSAALRGTPPRVFEPASTAPISRPTDVSGARTAGGDGAAPHGRHCCRGRRAHRLQGERQRNRDTGHA